MTVGLRLIDGKDAQICDVKAGEEHRRVFLWFSENCGILFEPKMFNLSTIHLKEGLHLVILAIGLLLIEPLFPLHLHRLVLESASAGSLNF